MPREQYLLDSAHHGIAMNPAGTRLCVAGTMSDYAAIVDARRPSSLQADPRRQEAVLGRRTSADGRYCFVSWSGARQDLGDLLPHRAVVQIPVGDHPQRMRNGYVARSLVKGL